MITQILLHSLIWRNPNLTAMSLEQATCTTPPNEHSICSHYDHSTYTHYKGIPLTSRQTSLQLIRPFTLNQQQAYSIWSPNELSTCTKHRDMVTKSGCCVLKSVCMATKQTSTQQRRWSRTHGKAAAIHQLTHVRKWATVVRLLNGQLLTQHYAKLWIRYIRTGEPSPSGSERKTVNNYISVGESSVLLAFFQFREASGTSSSRTLPSNDVKSSTTVVFGRFPLLRSLLRPLSSLYEYFN